MSTNDAAFSSAAYQGGSERVDPCLVEHASGLPPGVALVVGCGAGADLVWLAERGWRVTGVDAAEVALDRARQRAGEAGVADRTSWLRLEPGAELPGGADLVVVRDPALTGRDPAAVAAAVRHGGTLLICTDDPGSLERAGLGEEWQVEAADGVLVARRDEV